MKTSDILFYIKRIEEKTYFYFNIYLRIIYICGWLGVLLYGIQVLHI